MSDQNIYPWHYEGDVILEYGGIFVNVADSQWGYAEVVNVEDLDSACGFEGAVMIERGTANVPRTRSEARQVLRDYGMSVRDMLRLPKEQRRVQWAIMFWRCGFKDVETESTEILQLEEDGPLCFDGWTAERFSGDLREYVESLL